MRWAGFVILAVAIMAVQMSVGAVLALPLGGNVTMAVDFLAILAVFAAFIVPERQDALMAGWLLGLLIDLSVTAAPIGMNALCYAGAAGIVYNARALVFTDSAPTQFVFTAIFCLVAHGMARIFMNLYVRRSFSLLGSDLLSVLAISLATALAAMLLLRVLGIFEKWLVVRTRSRRRQR